MNKKDVELHVVSLNHKDADLTLRGLGTLAVFKYEGRIVCHSLSDEEYVGYRSLVYRNRKIAMEFLLDVVLKGTQFKRGNFKIEGKEMHSAALVEFGKEVEMRIKEIGGI